MWCVFRFWTKFEENRYFSTGLPTLSILSIQKPSFIREWRGIGYKMTMKQSGLYFFFFVFSQPLFIENIN